MILSIIGDTYFADSTAAYNDLPNSMKNRIDRLEGHYSYQKFRNSVPGVTEEEAESLRRGTDHPIITVHPLTGLLGQNITIVLRMITYFAYVGKKNIYANKAQTVSVNGVSQQESDEILQILFDQVERPEYLFVHKWSKNDAVLWDNRGNS